MSAASVPITEVAINGVEYVPKHTVIPDEAIAILIEVYSVLWAEGHYDPLTEAVGKVCRPLSDKMMRLNELLHFRK